MKRLSNPGLKLSALLLAVLTWWVISQITNNDKLVEGVPIRIDLPEGWAVRDANLNDLSITFRGTREDLLLLDERTVQVLVDLREEEFESSKVIQIVPRHVTFASSRTRITDIAPNILELQLDKEGTKRLPLKQNISGTLPRGVRLDSVELEPKLVTLVGAEELLKNFSALQTAPINLNDKIQSFEQRVDVLPPADDWVGRIEPNRVLVKIHLSSRKVERSFSGVPLLLSLPPATAMEQVPGLSETQVEVFLQGTPERLEALKPEEIRAMVPYTPGEKSGPVEVIPPRGVDFLGVQPSSIEFVLPEVPQEPENEEE